MIERFPARTPTLLPATHTNSYVLGGREALLVEPATPYEDEQRNWLAWAREIATTRKVVAILATHHHPDHVGGAAHLTRELGLPLWAHAATADRIDVPVARRLVDGEELLLENDRWQVLHTPGHAPGHVCLFDPESRSVIVGDMIASIGTILIAPGDGDMIAYLAQLQRLADLNASVALPAHGDPVPDPRAVFERYIAHRLAREAKILASMNAPGAGTAAAGSADHTADELVAMAYADVPPAIWPIAKLSIEAHLEKLEREGRIVRTERPGAFRVVG